MKENLIGKDVRKGHDWNDKEWLDAKEDKIDPKPQLREEDLITLLEEAAEGKSIMTAAQYFGFDPLELE